MLLSSIRGYTVTTRLTLPQRTTITGTLPKFPCIRCTWALPYLITWHVAVPRLQKILLSIVFCLALLVLQLLHARTI